MFQGNIVHIVVVINKKEFVGYCVHKHYGSYRNIYLEIEEFIGHCVSIGIMVHIVVFI